MKIEGHCQREFTPVEKAFAALWDEIEVGASLCIYHDGRPVVNLWGGYTNRAQTIQWQEDTLVNVYSTIKGIVALSLAQLVDGGRLEYELPVTTYWPAFGAEQKFDITVAQLISHQAGLYRFDPPVSVEDLYNWQKITMQLASQRPAWKPGNAFGYHPVTWGFLAGELIRQVTGVSPGTFISERLAGPLNADVYIGLPPNLHHRCATLAGPNHARKALPARKSAGSKTLVTDDPVITPFRHACSSEFRQAEIPATNGHASAVGLARCYQAALDGNLLSDAVIETATREVTCGEIDQVLGQPLRRSMGFILNCDDCYFGPAKNAFGHSGSGGSIAFADPENNVAFAYVMNQLHSIGPLRARQLINSFYTCLMK